MRACHCFDDINLSPRSDTRSSTEGVSLATSLPVESQMISPENSAGQYKRAQESRVEVWNTKKANCCYKEEINQADIRVFMTMALVGGEMWRLLSPKGTLVRSCSALVRVARMAQKWQHTVS